MQIITRALQDHCSFKTSGGHTTNGFIATHTCRHSTVHTGGMVEKKLLGQVANAKPRSIKQTLGLDMKITFSLVEIMAVGE